MNRAASTQLAVLAKKVMPANALASIKFHFILEHAWRDVLNHGNPYNHDAQGTHFGLPILQHIRDCQGNVYNSSTKNLTECVPLCRL